jgi:hypothetical protein
MNTEHWMNTWLELVEIEISDFNDFLNKYDSTVNREHWAKRNHVMYTYQSIGDLVEKGILSIDMVENTMGIGVIALWNKWGEIIKELRTYSGMPRLYNGFEYLYTELTKYYEKYPELKVLESEINSQTEI